MTEETNCYECDTPLVSVCPQCNPYLSAAPSPDGEEVERVAGAIEEACSIVIEQGEGWTTKVGLQGDTAKIAARAAISAMQQTQQEENAGIMKRIQMDADCHYDRGYTAGLIAGLDRVFDAHELADHVIKRTIERLQKLPDHAGQPAWTEIVAEEMRAAISAMRPAPKLTEEDRARVERALLDAQSLILDRFAYWESDARPAFRDPTMQSIYTAVREALSLIDKLAGEG